jgi:hypothetical protein
LKPRVFPIEVVGKWDDGTEKARGSSSPPGRARRKSSPSGYLSPTRISKNGIVLSPPGKRPKTIVSPRTTSGTSAAGPVRKVWILPSARMAMMCRCPCMLAPKIRSPDDVHPATGRSVIVIEIGGTFYLFRDDIQVAPEEPVDLVADQHAIPALATLNPQLASGLRALAAVARSEVPVVILGETGTGKELAARAVHAMSARSGPFVPVNCGGIPDALVESELFGVRRGALPRHRRG